MAAPNKKLSFNHWFKAYKKLQEKEGKKAKINADSRDAYYRWRAARGAPVPGSPQNPTNVAGEKAKVIPAFDPNGRDAQHLQDMQQLQANYNTSMTDLDSDYQTYLSDTFGANNVQGKVGQGNGMSLANVTKQTDGTYKYTGDVEKLGGVFANYREDRDEGFRNTLNSSAQRGMLRSGSQFKGNQDTRDAYNKASTETMTDYGRRQGQYTRGRNDLTSQYGRDKNQALLSNNQRRFEDYRRKHGV